MKKFLLSVLFFLLVSPNVYCEPSKTTQTLLDTPMSMLEWGMYKTTLEYTGDGFRRQLIVMSINRELKKKPNINMKFLIDGVCL